jgi:hypothetical protein
MYTFTVKYRVFVWFFLVFFHTSDHTLHLLLSPIPFNTFSRFKTTSSNTRYDLPVILMSSAQSITFIDLCYIVSVPSILDDPFPVQSSILNTLGVSRLSRLLVVKGRSYCSVFPLCNLISLCSLGLEWLISLEFQDLPLQEMCYIQTVLFNSVYRIGSSGFNHHHRSMCSNQLKTLHSQTRTSNCHTFKPMSFNVWMLGCCNLPDSFTSKYGGDVLNKYSNYI